MARDATRDHSGGGDPVRSLALLWRDQDRRTRPGKRDLSVDRVVAAAIEVADTEGLAALSMRRVAERLGVGTMSLYTYVPGKGELIDLMLDTAYGETAKPDGDDAPVGWRARLEQVARENWALHHRHPWMAHVGVNRPPLGPGVMAKYEFELRAVAGIGLGEVEMDTVLNLVLGHAETTARRAVEAEVAERDSGMTDDEWWQVRGPLLGALVDPRRFPTASAVGEAVGRAHNSAYDPAHNFEFGLRCILDGVAALVDSRRPAVRPPPTAP